MQHGTWKGFWSNGKTSRNSSDFPISDFAVILSIEVNHNKRSSSNIMKEDSKKEKEILHSLTVAHSAIAMEWMKEKSFNYRRLMAYYRCAMSEVETKFHVLDEEYSLQNDRNPISVIKSRLKSPFSIVEKLQKRNLEATIESIEDNLHDVAGIRVICSFVEDVYKLADALSKQDDVKILEIKDYIADPKPNGYRSLHLIVEIPIFLETEKRYMKVEVQLRTIAMDCWATLEHQLRYKKGVDFSEEMQNSLLRCSQIACEMDAEMDSLREKANI